MFLPASFDQALDGRYQVEHQVGAGSSGIVYRAFDLKEGRQVALKILTADQEEGSQDNSATREAELLAGLNHPGIVRIWDAGTLRDLGRPYLCMEWLEGLDLATHQRNAPLGMRQATALGVLLARALACAHDGGLLHRDIKPANILICRKGRQYDFVKVVDFGLVRITADSEQASKITETGEGKILGTPAYLAPESVTGSDPVDGRSDLYALGCVAFFLLTGHNVFEANSPMSMAVAHATETAKPPSSRGVPVPKALDELVLDCLAKRPGDRPRDAYSLSQRLGQIALDRPWDNQQAEEFWNGHLSDKPFLETSRTISTEAPTAIVEPLMSA